MTKDRLQNLVEKHNGRVGWTGPCHDCGVTTKVTADAKPEGIIIRGGAVYETQHGIFHVKCDDCHKSESTLKHYQPCEVYSRVVGYLRPVTQWNPGKRAEFDNRKSYF